MAVGTDREQLSVRGSKARLSCWPWINALATLEIFQTPDGDPLQDMPTQSTQGQLVGWCIEGAPEPA
jgi:hypothetical protein